MDRYFFALIWIKMFSIIGYYQQSACDFVFLYRSLNIAFSLGNHYIFYLLWWELHPINESQKKKREKERNLEALQMGTLLYYFPILYFFNFLYYTDVGGTFFVFLMYWLSLRSHFKSSAVSAIFAVAFRQTNIVWVGFTCVSITLSFYNKKKEKKQRKQIN